MLDFYALEALRQAVNQGWSDIAEDKYADVTDDELDSFIGQIGVLAARRRSEPAVSAPSRPVL